MMRAEDGVLVIDRNASGAPAVSTESGGRQFARKAPGWPVSRLSP
jgi:hypothetical protein